MSVKIVKIPYEPRGASRQLWQSKEREILIEGPAGTGKTRGTLEKIVALADKYPKSRHLICRKTRASMTESVLVTLEEKVFPPGSPIAAGPSRMQRQSYMFPNGSSIVVGGLDKPERTFSTEYDTIACFEASEATEGDWESLHRALRNGRMGYHQAICDTNPGAPSHWLNQRASTPKMKRLLSRHEDNPIFYDAEKQAWTPEGIQYLAVLDNLTGPRKARLRFGRWSAAEGAVYDEYDASVHVVDRFDIPPTWRRIRSIDFGYTNPFVCLWFAFDGDGRMYLYRQWYKTQTLVADHATTIKELSGAETFEATIADPEDAEGRATLHKAGIQTIPAKKEIIVGIQTMQAMLRKAGDGKSRFYVLRDSLVEVDKALVEKKLPTCIEEEFDSYIWPADKPNRSADENPVDANNHALDAARYAAMHRKIERRHGQVGTFGVGAAF